MTARSQTWALSPTTARSHYSVLSTTTGSLTHNGSLRMDGLTIGSLWRKGPLRLLGALGSDGSLRSSGSLVANGSLMAIGSLS
jgi:hypothetical protein